MPDLKAATGLGRVQMTLRDVLYVTFVIPAARLRNLVPGYLTIATVSTETAFLSVVVLRSTAVRMSALPFPRFNYNQFNIRTYVTDPETGRNAVYFLKSGVTSRFISLVTRTSGIPWQHIYLELKTAPDSRAHPPTYQALGNWGGDFSIQAERAQEPSSRPAFFDNMEAAADFLIRPLIGFLGNKRRLGRFIIWHPEVEPQTWRLKDLHLPLLTSPGLVAESEEPHSVFFVPKADFYIYMPPAFIKIKGGEP